MVYVAGPYTHPDPVENTHNIIRAGVLLRDAGYCPVLPHLSLLTHLVSPHEPAYWYEWDLRLLDRCDFMLRLPGESWGADREEEYANELGIPVHVKTAEQFLEAL
jgi:hypothetical protein